MDMHDIDRVTNTDGVFELKSAVSREELETAKKDAEVQIQMLAIGIQDRIKEMQDQIEYWQNIIDKINGLLA